MEFFCNDSHFPLVIFKVIGEVKSSEDIHKITRRWTEIYTLSMIKKQSFRLIFDASQVKISEIKLLKPMAEFLIKVKNLTEMFMDRTAIIVSDDKIKTFIRFVFNFYKPVKPFKVFTDQEKAANWVASNEPGDDPDKNFLKEKREIKESNISFD